MRIRTTDQRGVVIFFCPGCDGAHQVHTIDPNPLTNAKWTWNGDCDKPTFSPSLVVKNDGKVVCHSFINNGMIQYLSDCTHKLANQTVDIPDFDTIWNEEDF